MAISPAHKLEAQLLAKQLKNGLLSATDASRIAAEFIFMDSGFAPTEEKDIWRSFDEAITSATVEMLEKISK